MPKNETTQWLQSIAPHLFHLPSGQPVRPGEPFEVTAAEFDRLRSHPLLRPVPKPTTPAAAAAGVSEKAGDQS